MRTRTESDSALFWIPRSQTLRYSGYREVRLCGILDTDELDSILDTKTLIQTYNSITKTPL